MSLDFSVYVGAYLLVPTRLASQAFERQECSAHCGEPMALTHSRFCFGCGAMLNTVRQEAVAAKHWHCHELGQPLDELFFTPESAHSKKHDLWLPNQGGAGVTFEDRDTDVDALVAMHAEYVQQQRDAFMKKYGAVLFAIESQFKVKPLLQVGVVPFKH